MNVKLSRTNGNYRVSVANGRTGYSRQGTFGSAEEAISAIRAWQDQALVG